MGSSLKTHVSARELSSLVSKVIFAGAAFGNISRIMTRYCSVSVAFSQDWDSKFHLDQYWFRELNFWKENLTLINLKSVVDCLSKSSNYVVYSDASATGCGAHLDLNSEQVCHKLCIEIFQFFVDYNIVLEVQ